MNDVLQLNKVVHAVLYSLLTEFSFIKCWLLQKGDIAHR